MPVLAGLAIPKTAPNPAGAKQLIKYMDSVRAQAQMLRLGRLLPGRRRDGCRSRLGPGLLSMNAARQERSSGRRTR